MKQMKAPRHEGTKARRALIERLAPSLRRAFSLIEVLLAIFILGVGVISIAALFPAGIAQQRLSVDDIMGKTVADSAIEIIRAKIKPEYFGTFEEFDATPNGPPVVVAPRQTIAGDWNWLRPGFLFGSDPATVSAPMNGTSVDIDDRGSIDLFSWYYATSQSQPPPNLRATEWAATSGYPDTAPTLWGIPYNKITYGAVPPRIIITQRERYYPMPPQTYVANAEAVRPQYVWDCMFRRFQGKIYVAIFVYRVTTPGGGIAVNYQVGQNSSNPNSPPLPVWLNFIDPNGADANTDVNSGGPWNTFGSDPTVASDDDIVRGVADGLFYNPDDARQAWQQPRQWIIDQNNHIYRVTGNTREDFTNNTGDLEVQLSRPVGPVLGRVDGSGSIFPGYFHPNCSLVYPTPTPYFYQRDNDCPSATPQYQWIHDDVVTDIWYMPITATDANTGTQYLVTPVYAAVKEL